MKTFWYISLDIFVRCFH